MISLHNELTYIIQTYIGSYHFVWYISICSLLFIVFLAIIISKQTLEMVFGGGFVIGICLLLLCLNAASQEATYKKTLEYISQKEIKNMINQIELDLKNYENTRTTKNKDYHSLTHVLILKCNAKNKEMNQTCIKEQLIQHFMEKFE